MAVITQTTVAGSYTPVTITRTTLSASDTLVYVQNTGQKLELNNTTGGSLTATITGSGVTTVSPQGLGAPITVSTGYAVTVAAGAMKIVNLDSISSYLGGTITITGAATMTAALFV